MTVGTYTPIITAATPPAGAVYTSEGQWHISDDGKLMTVTALVSLSSKGTGGSGHVRVTLPQPVGADAVMSQGAVRSRSVTLPSSWFSGSFTWITAHAFKGRGDVAFAISGSGKPSDALKWADLGEDALLNFTIQYFL